MHRVALDNAPCGAKAARFLLRRMIDVRLACATCASHELHHEFTRRERHPLPFHCRRKHTKQAHPTIRAALSCFKPSGTSRPQNNVLDWSRKLLIPRGKSIGPSLRNVAGAPFGESSAATLSAQATTLTMPARAPQFQRLEVFDSSAYCCGLSCLRRDTQGPSALEHGGMRSEGGAQDLGLERALNAANYEISLPLGDGANVNAEVRRSTTKRLLVMWAKAPATRRMPTTAQQHHAMATMSDGLHHARHWPPRNPP